MKSKIIYGILVFFSIFSCRKNYDFKIFQSYYPKLKAYQELDQLDISSGNTSNKIVNDFLKLDSIYNKIFPIGYIDDLTYDYGFKLFVSKTAKGSLVFTTIDTIYPYQILDKVDYSKEWSLDFFQIISDSIRNKHLKLDLIAKNKTYWQTYSDSIFQIRTCGFYLLSNGKFEKIKEDFSNYKTFDYLPYEGKFSGLYSDSSGNLILDIKNGTRVGTKKIKIKFV